MTACSVGGGCHRRMIEALEGTRAVISGCMFQDIHNASEADGGKRCMVEGTAGELVFTGNTLSGSSHGFFLRNGMKAVISANVFSLDKGFQAMPDNTSPDVRMADNIIY